VVLKTNNRRALCQGQAMTEFLVAGLVLIPLFMGSVYLAKYADVKQSAIQASRYAVMERAFNPDKSAAVIAKETRVRFFTQQENRNKGAWTNKDKSYTPNAEKDQPAYWRDLSGKRLIDIDKVNVSFKGPMDVGGAAKVLDAAGTIYKLDTKGMYGANVEVALNNVTHFEPLSALNLKLGATTVIAGNAWNAGGNADVKEHIPFTNAKLKSAIDGLNSGLDFIFAFFEKSGGPNIWCVNPDVVPDARLENGLRIGKTYAPCGS
jgi:hypothetical protein